MASVTWTNAAGGDWTVASNWSTGNEPGTSDDVFISVAGSYTVSLTAAVTVGSITIADASAVLQIQDPGGDDVVTGNLDSSGSVGVDAVGAGGSTLTVGGTLTNSNYVQVGNSGMSTAALLTVGGTVGNTGASFTLEGGRTGAMAQVTVTGTAPSTLTGTYSVIANAGGASLQWGSGGITQIGDGASNGGDLYIDGADAFVEVGATNSNSALNTLGTIAGNGLLDLRDGVTVATVGGLTVDAGDGRLKVDAYGGSGGSGGSDVTIGGDLVNSSAGNFSDGGVSVGGSGITVSDTLAVDGTVSNTGIVNVIGGQTGAGAQMLVAGAAPSTLTGTYNIVGDAGGALLQFGSGGISQIGDGASLGGDLSLDGHAFAEIGATNSNSALTGLATIAGNGLLDLRDGETVTTAGGLTVDAGDGRLKVDAYGGNGGSDVTIGGDLANSSAGNFSDGGVSVGGSGITVSDTLTVDGTVANTGIVNVIGGQTGAAAQMLVTGTAPGTLTGTYNVVGDAGGAVLQFGSGGISQIGDGASLGGDLLIDGSNAFAEIGATDSNSALTGLTTIAGNGLLDLRDGNSVTTAGGLTVEGGDGRLKVDAYGGSGGSDVTIGGNLANSSFGNFSDGGVSVGSGNMSTGSTLTVDGAFNDTGGLLEITGGRTGAAAQMAVAGVAPGTLTGQYNIVADAGGASLQWGSGGITQIGDGAGKSGYLYIDGSNAFAEIGATNSNSALDTLSTIAGNGVLDLRDGVTVTTSGSLTVDGGDGRLKVDAYGGSGGSDVTIGGNLANSSFGNFSDGGVSVGNGNMSTGSTLTVDGAFNDTGGLLEITGGRTGAAAGMTVTGAAPGTLTGQYNIVGDAGGASLQWGSGGITQIGDGAGNSGYVYIDGSNAFAEIGATNSNSALDTLSTIASNGVLDLRDGVTVTTAGSLTIDGSDGRLKVDAYGGSGGSEVTIGGDLTNGSPGNFSDGGVAVGTGGMTHSDLLTVDGTFADTGGIVNISGGQTAAPAKMVVTGAVAGTLTGQYNIVGDAGGASLQWGSGGITQIGDGASNGGGLYLDGTNAFAEIGATNNNSALTSLATIAGNGLLDLRDGVTVTTSGSLTIDGSDGRLKVDAYGGSGGSDVTIGGDLTNGSAGSFSDGGVAVGTSGMTQSDLLTVDGTFTDTGGIVNIFGGKTAAVAQMVVTGAAAGTLTGQYNIVADAGGASLQWGSGGITQIGDGASNGGGVYLDGADAFAEIGATNSNSALTGLATIATNGLLDLRDGAIVTTSGSLTIDGSDGRLKVDGYGGSGGGDVTIGGDLVNLSAGSFSDGGVEVGNSGMTRSDLLTVSGTLVNNAGAIATVVGNANDGGAGQAVIATDAVTNAGAVNVLANAVLEVAAGNTYTQNGGDTFISGTLAADSVALNGGVIDLSTGHLDATTLTIAAGSSLIGSGTVTATISSTGSIEASGGSLDLAGGLAAPAALAIETSSALELAGADSGGVTFAGSSGIFTLDDPIGFTGTIAGLAIGDTLVLRNTQATGAVATYDAGSNTSTLAISLSGGGTLDFTLAGDYAGEAFGTNPVGNDTQIAAVGAAVGEINTPLPEAIGAVRQGAGTTEPLSITNNAPTGSAALDVSVGSVTGGATASGTIIALAPGATDATDITVGIGSGFAGVQTGTVTLDFASDLGSGNQAPLPSESVTVSGTVFREAIAAITPLVLYAHVGDPGIETIDIANIATADGYSENLIAALTGVTGGFTIGGSGPTGDIAAGTSNTTALTLDYSNTQSGVVSGNVTVALTSDGGTGAGSIDGLGTVALPSRTLPISIDIDNFATAAFATPTTYGTLAQNGNSTTLDLGTVAENTGLWDLNFGVVNTATGPADLLSGSVIASAAPGFSVSSLGTVSGLGAGQLANEAITLDTSSGGVVTQTITLEPTDSNAGGFSEVLAAQTLTVTGTVEPLPPPVITASSTLSGISAVPIQLGTLSIGDPNTDTLPLTVTVSDASGALTASQRGAGTVSGSGSTLLTLTGSVNDLNAELATLAYTAAGAGTDTIDISVEDQHHASAEQSVSVNSIPVPFTAPVVTTPSVAMLTVGQESGIGGLGLSDPYAVATGQTISLTILGDGTLDITGNSGATITGQGTDIVTITGTVPQIDADLADGLLETLAGGLGLGALSNAESALFTIAQAAGSGTLNGAALNAAFKQLVSPPQTESVLAAIAGEEGVFFTFGAEAASYALNFLASQVAGGGLPNPGSFLKAAVDFVLHFAGKGMHVVAPGGYLYNLDATGEFVLTASTQPGDSLLVQARLQPVAGSTSASEITEIGALVGNDRVTFGVGRQSVVWVDGVASNVSITNPVTLSGGTLSQVSANTYQIVYDTGELVTVSAQDTYLDVNVAPGANDPAGTIVGLANNSADANEILSEPNGTFLAGSLTTQQFYDDFVDAWRIPQSLSLLDYGPGQTTDTFTDLNFPETQISLSDLPSSVVAQAASVVAAAGILDPGVAAAAEYDYIASGGDPAVVTDDANQLGGISTTAEPITNSGPVPVAVGVIADQPDIEATPGTVTPVVFDVYLTGTASTATTIDYVVAAGGAGFLGASAFGGTLPSGSVVVQAGSIESEFTIDLPIGALGDLPSENLQVAISSPDGTPVFVATAQDTIDQPIPGPPPVPELVDLVNFGSFVENGNDYTLNLGSIQAGQPLPPFQFEIENAASAPSDKLGGTLSYTSVEGFTVSGASLPGLLGAGQSYQGLEVSATDVKFGENSETITFNPTDTNSSGFNADLAPITLTINDTIVPPSMVYSYAFGDVHIITYNGLIYNFQGEGEFTLAKSRIPNDSFDIQMRLQPLSASASVTVITQVAVSVGTDRVTFDAGRADTVYVDGTPSTISQTDPEITLNGGTLTQITPTTWQVNWNTGEQATVTGWGQFFNISDGIPIAEPNLVGGLQGEDAGASNDFQLANGTVLPQPLTTSELYGDYADSWRVTQTSSLFDYLPGQDTGTFTDPNFPEDIVSVGDLPSTVVAPAEQMVTAAGITDPNIAQDTVLDYLATGDPAFIQAGQQVSSLVNNTTIVTPTVDTPVVAALGVEANPVGYTEATSGPTATTFDAYLTNTSTSDIVVNYSVVAAGAGFFDASTFGGTLPSGSVTITAGGTLTPFTIDVPANALGTTPTEQLEVAISSPGSVTPLFAPTAIAAINNSVAEPGAAPIAQLLDINNAGTLIENSATSYTLDLGTLTQGQSAVLAQLGIENQATIPADDLSGTFGAPTGTGFLISGNSLPGAIAAGQQFDGLYVTAQTSKAGLDTETMVFTPRDVNASGFVGTMAPITLTITDIVTAPGVGALNSPDTIVFPNVHVGGTDEQAISVSNTGSAPIAVSVFSYNPIISTGSIAALAPGAMNNSALGVGVNTGSAGAQSGQVLVNFGASDPPITVFGDVFSLASGTIAPVTDFVHVGAAGTVALDISNGATANGFSENLLASLASVTGNIGIAAAGPTGEIAAGSSDTSSLLLDFSTAQVGTITGTATVDLTSDGGTGVDSIDGLGTTALGSMVAAVTIMVDNFANPVFEDASAVGTFAQNGTAYTLDLGAIQQNAAPVAVDLGVLNDVAGPADVASGSLAVSGSSSFTNSGFDPFADLAAGQADIAPMVTLATGTTGTFSETITLAATGSNADFSAVLPSETLTVTGTVVPGGTPGLAALTGTLANIGVVAETPLTPASGLTVTDAGVGDIDTVSITLANPAFGTPSNLGSGSYDGTTGVYSVSGAPDVVTTAIDGLQLTPAAPAADVYLTSTAVGLAMSGSGGGSATQSAIDASVQQVLGLASVPVGDIAISVSADGTGLAAPIGGDTNEAAVTNPTTGATYSLPTGYAAEYLGGSADATLQDTAVGNAVLVGNTGNDVLIAGAANDSIVAGDGNNTLEGGSGTTALVVGNGNDSITTAASSTDAVTLGGGTDTVFASGSGTVLGGSGSDLIDASSTGPSASDMIFLQGLQGSVLGGAGGLTVLDQGAHDTIQAASGAATVTLNGSFDRTRGGTGSFTVLDQTANNTVIGGTADTMFVTVSAAAANSDVFGRAGNTNILDLGADALMGTGGGTSVVSIAGAGTQLYGAFSPGGTLNASIGAANALVFGLADNATVDASSAAATGAQVYGGFSSVAADNGTLSVEAGADSLVAITGGSNSTINAGSGGLYTFIGTGSLAGSTVINGASASQLYVAFLGGAGSATVFGGEAAASVFGVDGTDATYVNTMAGAPGGFLVANGSAAGSETVNAAGSTTNDSLFAAAGNVSLVAGSGTDFLDAEANTGSLGGAGTVVGGDTMVAGGGSDLIFFSHAAFRGGAVVINFSSLSDTVVLSGYNSVAGGNQASMALADATTAGTDTTIALADGTHITFVDATAAQLQGHLFST